MEETEEKEHVSHASYQEVAPVYGLAVQLQASAEPSPGEAPVIGIT